MKMNKILTAIVAVVLAVTANASYFSWKTSMTGKIYEAGTQTLLASSTAYLFDSAVVSQQAVLDAVLSGTQLASIESLSSHAVANGVIANSEFEWGTAGDTLTCFVALMDGENVYISAILTADAQASATAPMQLVAKATSQADAMTSSTFTGAGWYTAVPEPTSALLALLGFAGLALRRRRA